MNSIVNTLALNADGVLFAGADNGNMSLYDYKTGLPFQTMSDIPQPGSLDAEAGIFASAFDQTVRLGARVDALIGQGTRLITACADKTVKIYSEQT